MGLFPGRQVKTSTKTTEADAPALKLLNTKHYSSGAYGVDELMKDLLDQIGEEGVEALGLKIDFKYKEYVDGKYGENDNNRWIHFLGWIGNFKAWHLSKFDWKGLPEEIIPEKMEDNLWSFGSVVIFKYKKKFIFTSYTILSWDIYGNPLKIQPLQPAYQKATLKFGEKKNGKDCVIINHSAGDLYPSFWALSSLLKIWPHIMSMVNIFSEFETSSQLQAQRMLIGDGDPNNKVATQLNNMIAFDKRPFMNFNVDSLGSRLKGKDSDNSLFIDLEDRSANRRDDFDWSLMVAMRKVGMKHASNLDKKERNNTAETTSEDQYSSSIVNTELDIRKNNVKMLNKVFDLNVSIDFKEDFNPENKEEEEENPIKEKNNDKNI